jgi:6-phosphogluconolactonase
MGYRVAMQVISEQSKDELYIKAAPLIIDAIVACCRRKGGCIIGMMGGRSAVPLLDRMLPYAQQLSGCGLHIFWIDERLEEGEKNYAPALPLLEQFRRMGVDLSWHPLRATHKESIRGEMRQVLEEFSSLRSPPGLDIVIASAGEDGHIASLFPRSPALKLQDPGYAIVENAPKPPPVRVTMTPPLLATAHDVFLFFVGKKREAYEAFMRGVPIEECPCRLLTAVPRLAVLTSFE